MYCLLQNNSWNLLNVFCFWLMFSCLQFEKRHMDGMAVLKDVHFPLISRFLWKTCPYFDCVTTSYNLELFVTFKYYVCFTSKYFIKLGVYRIILYRIKRLFSIVYLELSAQLYRISYIFFFVVLEQSAVNAKASHWLLTMKMIN